MPGGYVVPATGDFGELTRVLAEHKRDIAEIGRPSGTQTANLVRQLFEIVNGLTEATDISVSGAVTAGGDITSTAGDFYSPHGRATPVTTSYVSAWFNGDGRIGATASSFKVKQDIEPADMTKLVEALRTVALVKFRRIEAVEKYGDDAPTEIGGIAEYFLTAGLEDYVFFHPETGEPQGINYELLTIPLIAAFQSLDARLTAAGF